MRGIRWFAGTLIALIATATPASASEVVTREPRFLIVSIPGTTIGDWDTVETPSLRSLISSGPAALLSARTSDPIPTTESECLDHAGPKVLRTGAIASRDDSLPFLHGLRFAAGSAGVPLREVRSMTQDISFPGARRFDYRRALDALTDPERRLTLFEIPDVHLADCIASPADRERWRALSVQRADEFVGQILRTFNHRIDSLIVLSPTPPLERQRERNFLTVVAARTPRLRGESSFTSATTRRDGLVSLTDVASTVFKELGGKINVGTGRPFTGVEDYPGRTLIRDDNRYATAARNRPPTLRAFVWGASIIALIATLLVLSGRGRASGSRLPLTVRDVVGVLLASVCAAPAAMLVVPNIWSLPVAIGAALVLTGLARPQNSVASIALWSLAASPLLVRSVTTSPLSYSLAEGARFYGIGNELMGVVIVGLLLWSASQPGLQPFRLTLLVLASTTVLMAAPQLGAKFGSVFVAVPAFSILLVRTRGWALDRRAAIGIAALTCFVAGVAVAADMLGSPETRSHIGAVAGGGDVVSRKIGAALRLALGSYWTVGAAICGVCAGIFVWRRPSLVARAFWGRPYLRTALGVIPLAAVLAVAFNDAGIVAASLMIIIGTAAFLHVMLVENAPQFQTPLEKRAKEFFF